MRRFSIIILLGVIAFSSCSDEEFSNSQDHFIFGGFAGECIGNCARFYQIQNEQLFEDDLEYWTWNVEDLSFKKEPLSEEKYIIAFEFYEKMPVELAASPGSIFGQPDAYDQGGYFISLKRDGNLQFWTIDTNKDVLPDYLVSYMEDLDEVMEKMLE